MLLYRGLAMATWIENNFFLNFFCLAASSDYFVERAGRASVVDCLFVVARVAMAIFDCFFETAMAIGVFAAATYPFVLVASDAVAIFDRILQLGVRSADLG